MYGINLLLKFSIRMNHSQIRLILSTEEGKCRNDFSSFLTNDCNDQKVC